MCASLFQSRSTEKKSIVGYFDKGSNITEKKIALSIRTPSVGVTFRRIRRVAIKATGSSSSVCQFACVHVKQPVS